jgi:plasmid stability protein
LTFQVSEASISSYFIQFCSVLQEEEGDMGRPPMEKKQRQLAVALPADVRSDLEKAAAAAGHSIAEEIRKRINITLENEKIDPATQELATDIMQLAEWISREKRFSWHSHPKAHEAFVEAIKEWLAELKPKRNDPVALPSDLMWGNDDPSTLGRSIARHYRRFKTEMEKSDLEIRKLYRGEKS